MKNKIFNKAIFTTSLNAIHETELQMEKLAQKTAKYYQELDAVIQKSLMDYKWQPYYNEKAVYIMLEERTAWHIWFLEEDSGSFRFREAPNEFTDVRHFYRQPIFPPETIREKHEWIVPMWLFQEISSLVELDMTEDRYLDQ
jgi:hypothetical protein